MSSVDVFVKWELMFCNKCQWSLETFGVWHRVHWWTLTAVSENFAAYFQKDLRRRTWRQISPKFS